MRSMTACLCALATGALPVAALGAASGGVAFGPTAGHGITLQFQSTAKTGAFASAQTIRFDEIDAAHVRLSLTGARNATSVVAVRDPGGALTAPSGTAATWTIPLALYSRLARLATASASTPDGGSDPVQIEPIGSTTGLNGSLTRTRTGAKLEIVGDGTGSLSAAAGAPSLASANAVPPGGGGSNRRRARLRKDATGGLVSGGGEAYGNIGGYGRPGGYGATNGNPPGNYVQVGGVQTGGSGQTVVGAAGPPAGGFGAPSGTGPYGASPNAAIRLTPRSVHITIDARFSGGRFRSATFQQSVANASLGTKVTRTWTVTAR